MRIKAPTITEEQRRLFEAARLALSKIAIEAGELNGGKEFSISITVNTKHDYSVHPWALIPETEVSFGPWLSSLESGKGSTVEIAILNCCDKSDSQMKREKAKVYFREGKALIREARKLETRA